LFAYEIVEVFIINYIFQILECIYALLYVQDRQPESRSVFTFKTPTAITLSTNYAPSPLFSVTINAGVTLSVGFQERGEFSFRCLYVL
jgi:hypothetical protein